MNIAAARSATTTGRSGRGPGLRLITVGLGIAVVPLDTAVNIGFPDITRSFDLAIPMIQWIVICYILTHAALMLSFGRAGDIWNHATIFRAGLLWSSAAFVGCAVAPSYGWLLAARVLQGIGAGLVISCGPALVTSLYPEERRGRAVGAFTLIFAIASAAGPLLGGELVQHWGWPAVFWFRVPIALAAAALFRGLPPQPSPTVREPLDIAGAVLLAVGLSSLLFAVDELQHLGERGFLLVPLTIMAAGSLGGFVWWENRVTRPIIRLELFRSADFAVINAGAVLLNATTFAVLLLVPYYLARLTPLPLSIAGIVLATGFVGMAAASLPAGWLLARVSAARLAPLGAAASGAGLFLIGSWQGGGSTPAMVATLLLQGFGMGIFQVAYMESVLAALPPQHRGVAGSLSMLTRTVGIVAGATLLTLLFHGLQAHELRGGATEAAAFLPAFRMTFRVAGLASVAAGAILFAATKPGR